MLPALASDTALEIALEEMALFLFMISSNSASLKGVRDGSMSLQIHKKPHVIWHSTFNNYNISTHH